MRTETKVSHTAGPWIVDDRHIHCAKGLTYPADSPANQGVLLETDLILMVDTDCHPNGLLTETDKANLYLAAAAPELLEACKAAEADLDAAIQRLPQRFTDREDLQQCQTLLSRIRAAIARAEGREA